MRKILTVILCLGLSIPTVALATGTATGSKFEKCCDGNCGHGKPRPKR